MANLEKIDRFTYLIPAHGRMKVPGKVFSSEQLIKLIAKDSSVQQVENVAHLPGIVGHSMAMPDMHQGYGFPIGGVAAFRTDGGVISPGGVGYDINCGCRIMTTNLEMEDVQSRLKEIVAGLFRDIPCGVGSTGQIHVKGKSACRVMERGAAWAVQQGYGTQDDLDHTEENGFMEGADPSLISKRAFKRGAQQLGTLGAGNHFIEVQVVEEVFDTDAADVFGLRKNQVTVMIHTGSRGFGYQVCDDFLAAMTQAAHTHGIHLPDRQLCCAPFSSRAGQDYFAAMKCAANYAWANRQCLTHWARESLGHTLRMSPRDLGGRLVYDVAHNIAKVERHRVAGKTIEVCVHRKGATRAFPAGHPALPENYRSCGQPVLIPGDMGTASYILVGQPGAMEKSFGSTCHGAGRVMSRKRAIKEGRNRSIARELEEKGIVVMARGRKTLWEEMPDAYKDISAVVDVVEGAGLSQKVVRLRPLGVVKG